MILAVALVGPALLLGGLLRRPLEAPLLGAAAWVIAFWWLWLLPVGWQVPVTGLGLVSLAAGALRARRSGFRLLPAAGVWGLAAAVVALLASSALVAPGVDGAMHTAVARVLADAGGHPSGFRPLWPVDRFGSYPVGQPTLTALIAACGLSWRQAGLTGHALAYGGVVIAFASLASRWTRREHAALLGAAVPLLARDPLHYWTWGGAPNALGIAFAVAAFAAGASALRDEEGRDRSAIECGVCGAASLLTHGVSVAALGWALLPLALLFRRAHARPVLLAGLAAAVCCAPWLATLHDLLGPRELQWARDQMHETVRAGVLPLVPRALHDVPVIAAGACAALLLVKAPRRALFPLALAAALLLLMANANGSWLPFSVLLYPDRIAALLLIPATLLACEALAERPLPRLAAVALGAPLLVHAAVLQWKTVSAGRDHALATADDLRVLAALDAQVPSGCWVLNNYGDAGQWIPALIARPITFPQVNVLFFDEARAVVHPCAALRGSKRPYFVDEVAATCPGPSCIEAGRSGESAWYRITDAGLQVPVSGLRP